jgi:hypothetical protein
MYFTPESNADDAVILCDKAVEVPVCMLEIAELVAVSALVVDESGKRWLAVDA